MVNPLYHNGVAEFTHLRAAAGPGSNGIESIIVFSFDFSISLAENDYAMRNSSGSSSSSNRFLSLRNNEALIY